MSIAQEQERKARLARMEATDAELMARVAELERIVAEMQKPRSTLRLRVNGN